MTTQQKSKESLFDKIGGMTAVNTAVDIFYKKVMADERINHFFEKIDMSSQSGKMKTFLAYAFGAPMAYSGKNMQMAHQHMKITDEHFSAVAGHLVNTLQELTVPEDLINEVVDIAMSVKDQVVNFSSNE